MLIVRRHFLQILATIFLATIGEVADWAEARPELTARPILRAFIDNFAHLFIGILSWTIIFPHPSSYYDIMAVAFFSSMIDIDHFLQARSFKIQDALHAPSRGIFHCSGLMIALTILISLFRPRLFLIMLISIVSHHLRDSFRRGLFLFPPDVHTPPLPKNMVRILLIIFPWTVYFINSKIYNNGGYSLLKQNPNIHLV